MHRTVAAIVLMAFTSMTFAGPGFFPSQQQMSPAPMVSVLSTITVGEKSRPENIIDEKGRRARIDYHTDGRVHGVSFIDEKKVAILHYGANGKIDGGSVLDLTTGVELFTTQKKLEKQVLSPECGTDVDCAAVITVVGSYDNPWAGDFWGGSGPGGDFSWVQLTQPPPPDCSKTECNHACDVGLATAGIGCTALGIAWAPLGLLCAAAALAGWIGCGNNCNAYCARP
jgi:hypothetical protein